MNISIIVNPIEIDGGWSPWSKRLGGSEETVVKVCDILNERHNIMVFHNGEHGVYNGVRYLPHEDFVPGDVTMNVNYPQFKSQGKKVYFTSLLDNPDLSDFDAVCCISNYAKENTNIKHNNVFIIPLGYDAENIYPQEKTEKLCIYTASPDRGLSTLEKIWPSIVAEHPTAKLVVSYGGQIYTPNTECGVFTEEEMNELYRKADVWIHPANGGELYCVNAIKAQAAGAIPVYFPVMALGETVRHGVPCLDARDMAQKLIELLYTPNMKNHIRSKLSKLELPTWRDTAEKLESVIINL